MTPAEARAISRSAYIFVFPLVRSYVSMYEQAVDPSSSRYRGGFGRWSHDRTATTSHLTTVHSSIWLDLRAEPWVFTLPEMDVARPSTIRVTDLWGSVVHETGDDPTALTMMVASPTRAGEAPSHVDKAAYSDSAFVRSDVWIDLPEPLSLREVATMVRHLGPHPLSAHLGVAAPPSAPAILWRPAGAHTEAGDDFWSVANFALMLTTPRNPDRSMLERLAQIGVTAGEPWDPGSFPTAVVDAIADGIDAAISELMRASAEVADRDGLRRLREDTDWDYVGRALAALR